MRKFLGTEEGASKTGDAWANIIFGWHEHGLATANHGNPNGWADRLSRAEGVRHGLFGAGLAVPMKFRRQACLALIASVGTRRLVGPTAAESLLGIDDSV